MTPVRSVNPVSLCACSSTGGSFPQPQMRSSGRSGSGAAQLSGTNATAVPRRAASTSKLSTLSAELEGYSATGIEVTDAYAALSKERIARELAQSA